MEAANNCVEHDFGSLLRDLRTEGRLNQRVIETVRDGVEHLNVSMKRLSGAQKHKKRGAEAIAQRLLIKPLGYRRHFAKQILQSYY